MKIPRRGFSKGAAAGALAPAVSATAEPPGIFDTLGSPTLLAKVKPLAGAGAPERFESTRRYDSRYHQKQHGFL